MKNNIHVIFQNEKWIIKEENTDKPSKYFENKDDAIEYSRKKAKDNKVELIIHNADGKISNKDSYGNDPYPPEG